MTESFVLRFQRKVKVKVLTIPLQACTGPEGSSRLRISEFLDCRQMKLARMSALPVTCWDEPRAIVRMEGLSQWKSPTSSPRIEPATSQLVAQCLSQLRHRVNRFQRNYMNKCVTRKTGKEITGLWNWTCYCMAEMGVLDEAAVSIFGTEESNAWNSSLV